MRFLLKNILNEMEIFLAESTTKNGIRIKVCGICKMGYAAKACSEYKNGISSAVFQETHDEYIVDLNLNRLIVSISIKEVFAVGASVFVEGVKYNSGGIIANPFIEGESADDDIDYIGNGLYCIAFSGRFGAVFDGGRETAEIVKKGFIKFLEYDNEEAVLLAEQYLKSKCRLYIFVSDGCGEKGKFYVSAYKK